MAYDIFISYRRKGGGSERAQLLNARFLHASYKEDDMWNDCQEFIKKLNSLTGLNFRLPTSDRSRMGVCSPWREQEQRL